MHRSAEAGQRDTSGALANPPAPACRPSAIGDGSRSRVGALSRAAAGIGLCPPPARLDVCPREKSELERKRRRQTEGERWLVQRGQLLTAVFLFYFLKSYIIGFLEIRFSCILFYCFLEIRFNFIRRNPGE